MSTLSVDTITGRSSAGTVNLPAGYIVQAKTNIIQDQTLGSSHYVYITSTSYTYSGASLSITPKISGSTILISFEGRLGSSYPSYINHMWSIRDNGGSELGDYTSSYPLYFNQRYQTGDGTGFMYQQGIDTNVTSAQTYKLYGKQSNGNGITIYEPVIATAFEIAV
tara:strand:+ start:1253 stop:1750 length:498 start_codon:yes stop_codon:yes gene_type:complete